MSTTRKPRIIWGTLAAAAVTTALAGCGSTTNAGPAASEVSSSATPTGSPAAGDPGSGTGTGSPGTGSPSSGSPSTGTGDGSGTGTGNGSGTGTGSGSGTGNGTGNGGGAGTSGEHETDGGAEWSRCTSDNLSAHVTEPDGAVGSRYAYLVLTNDSRGPCYLRGWSGLQLTGTAGPVPTQVVHEGSPYRILVPAGLRAYERLHWTVVHTGDETGNPCQPVATELQVTPPHATEQITAAWEHGPVCGHGTIRMTPVKLSPGNS